MQTLKKIYTVLVLIKNLLFRKRHYKLTFDRDDFKIWYYRFNHWGFDPGNLMMVNGADTLCEELAGTKDSLTVEIYASRKRLHLPQYKYAEYQGEDMSQYKSFRDKYFYGRHYTTTLGNAWGDSHENLNKFWICPVTLFVLGRYPNYIYIRKD
jgi:hypothetical protein